MALKIHKYPDLSGPLYHHIGNETFVLRFSRKLWLYLLENADGSLTPIDGVTGSLRIVDKSAALLNWATKLFFEKALALLEANRRGDFVEVEYDDLVSILTAGRNENKNVLESAGEVGHAAHAFVESLVRATMAEDENRRLEVLSKFPEDTRATNAAVACLVFMAEHNVRYLAAEQRVFSKELLVAGTMDGDIILDSCQNKECACQAFAPFTNKRVVLDLKTSNSIHPTYLAQVHVYWHAKVSEFPDVRFDGAVILRLGKDNQSEFEPFFSMGDEEHEKGLLFFKRALDLTHSVKEAEESMRAVRDARREKIKAAKDAALRIRCSKADVYKGARKSKCFDDGTQCEACQKLFIDKSVTKVL